MMFDQLCFKTRKGIIVLREKNHDEDELISREFRQRGFEMDVLASSKLQHDYAHTHQRLNYAQDNVFVFRRKTSRPRQSWVVCNREDVSLARASRFHDSIGKTLFCSSTSHVKQGDSILDSAIESCRLHLGRYCTQSKVEFGASCIYRAKDRGQCERSFNMRHTVLIA